MPSDARIPPGLPTPAPDALRHCERTAKFLAAHIRESGGRISFGDFMHQVLYAPGVGYYVTGGQKLGSGGDFVTAPEVSPVFGRVVATQCREILGADTDRNILELGAGSGALAVSILERLAELDALPSRYLILEISPELAQRQRRVLTPLARSLSVEIEWLDGLPERFAGVIVANEVADALPVERFRREEDTVLQQFVELGEDGGLAGCWQPASPALRRAVAEIEDDVGRQLEAGYRSEVALGLGRWVMDLGQALDSGTILLFDYGLPRREYYAVDRSSGWLRCHFRHHAHDSPFIYPGIQDLTAWVDFSAVARAATTSGLAVGGFVTQAMFLMSGGLDNEFSHFGDRSPQEQFELAEQVKRLTLPTEMGENFKCISLSSPGQPTPSAFAEANRRASL